MDFPEETFEEIIKIFQVESEEIISRINNSLLSLEKNPSDKDAISILFRDAHSLKGASRMVGFNSVQTIAHKIEDILGLAKEDKLNLNSKVVDILYKTMDFLAELIQKSIMRKKDVSDDISSQLSKLNEIEKGLEVPEEKFETAVINCVDSELLVQNVANINEFISESLFLLMKMQSDDSEELIDELNVNIAKLYAIFEKIGYFEIKKKTEDVKVKLEFTCKASHSLTNDEKEKIREDIDKITDELISIYEENNIEVVDYYTLAFEKNSSQSVKKLSKSAFEEDYIIPGVYVQGPIGQVKKETEEGTTQDIIEEVSGEVSGEICQEPAIERNAEQGEEQNKDILAGQIVCNPDDLTCIKAKFDDIQSPEIVDEVRGFLINFEKKCIDENIRLVLRTILKILDFTDKNQLEIDDDVANILKQSIDYCDNTIKTGSETADKELVLQQLEIVQKILEFGVAKPEETGFAIKNKKITDFSAVFETGEIKTLRVDSEKLDKLVNQVGDLMVTKIKTKKHLHELNLINKNLKEWQRNSAKALTYLKYYSKKNALAEGGKNTNTFFVKQLLGLFEDSNKRIQETVYDISSLQRNIQEDDMKMNFIMDDLEGMVKKIRVLPLATVFHLFGRMVRDIAQEKNKKIELEIIGSETSTDKKIIEEIKTPLIHIIRNAIDHGIETPEERVALGKNPVGKIILRASQIDTNVIIEIIDDGRGVNLEKIKQKAIRKGYLTEDEINSMTDEQVTNIIFSPGFSTGDQITSISGRGIGLDVVQTKISQLNGKVKVISEINKGCCVQIELPTTMSTLKAFLVNSSNQTFAVPMAVIKTVLRKKKDEILFAKGGDSIIFEGRSIPLRYLADILSLPRVESDSDKETILIIENDNKMIALAVDKLVGDQEILHKKLSAPLYRLKNVSGITTLMSGEVCLILNVSDILKSLTTAIKIPKLALPKPIRNSSDCKVLLVDDSITTRTIGKNMLEKAGYEPETAENPSEALEKMKLTRFDLIITDVEMPEMNGFEFLRKIKTDEKFYDIPVIMVTSVETNEHRQLAKDLGATKYIVKNEFDQQEFKKIVDDILLY